MDRVHTIEYIYGGNNAEGGAHGSALHKEGVTYGGDLHIERIKGPHRGIMVRGCTEMEDIHKRDIHRERYTRR